MTMSISPSAVQPVAIASTGYAAAASGAPSLLPGAGSMSIDGINDAMSMIYALMSKQSRNQLDSGTTSLKGKQGVRKMHEAEEKAARERQQKADGDGSRGFFSSIGHFIGDIVHNVTTLHVQDLFTDAKDDVIDAANSPEFWKDLESGGKVIGEVAALVGSAVATGVTFGAAAPALVVVACIGLSMMAAGVLESKVHYLEAMGMDGDTANAFGIGLSIGGAALTFGAGALAGAGAATGSVTSLASKVMIASDLLAAEGGVVEGTAHIAVGHYKADSEEAGADMTQAKQAIARSQRLIEELLDAVKDINDSHKHALGTLQGAMKTNSQTLVIASTRA
jgi:hypothetical protein